MKKLPAISDFFVKYAPEFGASVIVDSEYGYAGRILFPNGVVRYFKYNHIDINTVGSSEIARDKDYGAFFLAHLGYPTIEGKTFFSTQWARDIGSSRTIDEAISWAESLGYPVYIKPNGSGLGMGVALVYDEAHLREAIDEAFIYDKVILVQRAYMNMNDYRIVVLDGEIQCAYRKTPLTLVGNGTDSVNVLFDEYIEKLKSEGRDISVTLSDYRIKARLIRQGYTTKSVLQDGISLPLLANANLSQGGQCFDETDMMSDEWKKLSVQIARDMNLRFCGIDVLVRDGISGEVGEYVIVEMNASPGLNHYRTLNATADARVEHMYKNILTALSKDNQHA